MPLVALAVEHQRKAISALDAARESGDTLTTYERGNAGKMNASSTILNGRVLMKINSLTLRISSVLFAPLVIVLIAQPIFAQKAFLKKLKEIYPDVDKNAMNCKLCHNYDKAKKEEPEKKNINAVGKALHDQPAMKTVIDQKDGDDHKFTAEELKNVEIALKLLFPDKAALEKAITEKK